MRDAATILSDIASTKARLAALHGELRQIGRDKNAEIVAEFMSGKTIKAIATDRGVSVYAISGVLLRAGHTVKGRRKAQEQLANRAIVERYAARQKDASPAARQLVGSP